VFAAKVVAERDRLRGVCDLRLHIMERLEKERDEARAEAASSLAMAKIAGDKHDQKCAEVDVLRGAGCEEDGDGPCGVCRKCAYRRGAEDMRLACQQWCRAWENDGEAIADALADLRVEDKP
jgi:hypothetical protein